MNESTVRFQALLQDEWEGRCRFDPLFASRAGVPGFEHLLPDFGEAAQAQRRRDLQALLASLEQIPPTELAEEARLDREILARLLGREIDELGFQTWRRPISKSDGFHTVFASLPDELSLERVEDFEALIERLHAFPAAVEGLMESMRAGIRAGQAPPRATLEGVPEQIAAHLPTDPEQSRLFRPFVHLPAGVEERHGPRLREAARRAVQRSVLPAYGQLSAFFRDEALPTAAERPGALHLPEGRAFYEHRVRAFTTLPLTPEEIHRIGLEEVRRIRQEMEACAARAGHAGRLAEYRDFLRRDPRFTAPSTQELLRRAAWIMKSMEGQLPRFFGRLPRTPCGLVAMSDDTAPGNTTARYWPPSGDGRVAGFYHLNTWDLPSRPLYELEALSLHEAVPGHHLQIALQQELELSAFRRFADFTAFIEGWALYAERLGLEAGFYQEVASDFGRLSYEMWRACRLVVDTGLHALDWSREQAMALLLEQTALTPLNVANEVDRYLAWPGQALAYKIGELAIRRLRAAAEEQLGADFDLRAFHDELLGAGALPLDLLESRMEKWQASSRQRSIQGRS